MYVVSPKGIDGDEHRKLTNSYRVYRGKPSAGCENCRKAKKRCSLERPACSRCVKLKKICSGYRDTTGLQIQDESETVRRKADRHKIRTTDDTASVTFVTRLPSLPSDSFFSDDLPESTWDNGDDAEYAMYASNDPVNPDVDSTEGRLVVSTLLRPKADDVAVTFFHKQFNSVAGHWGLLRQMAEQSRLDPTLSFAIRACGMASLDNVQCVVRGRDMARIYYAEALGLLNASLRDAKKCKSDESLIAVMLLGMYENLTCENRRSIQSWKTHIRGATQLLRLRGKQQFQNSLGRMLFRELRAQILIACIWDDVCPPEFLNDWNAELREASPDLPVDFDSVDNMSLLAFDFAVIQNQVAYHKIPAIESATLAAQLEVRLIEWSSDLMQRPAWRYHEIDVDDSPNVWNGIVHAYTGAHAGYTIGGMWNTYRTIRIMLTRTCERLCRRISEPEEMAPQLSHFRTVRRQMADEICCAVPSQLGHAAPAWNSPSLLLSAYTSIWPLFFAGTCVLERVGSQTWTEIITGKGNKSQQSTSSAAAQAAWIIGRMDYISKVVGLRWADGMVAVLKGDFESHDNQLPLTTMPAWAQKIKDSGRGPRILLLEESPFSDALHLPREEHGPIWLGRALEVADKYNRPV